MTLLDLWLFYFAVVVQNGSNTQSWLLSRRPDRSFASGWYWPGVEENNICKTSTKQILDLDHIRKCCCKYVANAQFPWLLHIVALPQHVLWETWVFCYYWKQVDVYKLRENQTRLDIYDLVVFRFWWSFGTEGESQMLILPMPLHRFDLCLYVTPLQIYT